MLMILGLVSTDYAQQKKLRIFVVSSYHREYLWEQDLNKGLCAAMLDFKFLDNKEQTEEYTKNDFVETDKTVLKKEWMDSKRKSSKQQQEQSAIRILKEIDQFKPDLIILGDDNASNYIGTQYIDSDIPVVFWGIDGIPLKYGLIDSLDHPGHNVTGVYQTGYPAETIRYFMKLVPNLKTFAILSDGSETGKAKSKGIIKVYNEGKIPLRLIETVTTNSLTEWQAAALRLQDKVDAFFVVNHNTLKDKKGDPADPLQVAAWYLKNIKKPECTTEKQFVEEGFLFTVDDSGFKQAYEAVRMAHIILHEKKKPADIPVMVPTRGAVMVNRERAQMLRINLSDKNFIEEYVDKILSLEKYPQNKRHKNAEL